MSSVDHRMTFAVFPGFLRIFRGTSDNNTLKTQWKLIFQFGCSFTSKLTISPDWRSGTVSCPIRNLSTNCVHFPPRGKCAIVRSILDIWNWTWSWAGSISNVRVKGVLLITCCQGGCAKCWKQGRICDPRVPDHLPRKKIFPHTFFRVGLEKSRFFSHPLPRKRWFLKTRGFFGAKNVNISENPEFSKIFLNFQDFHEIGNDF